MARKNGMSAHRTRKLGIAKGHHFLYSVNEDGSDATVVRYLGEQDNDRLYCYLPDGFAMWIHIHYLANVPHRRAA
jgi:hypothetical protein